MNFFLKNNGSVSVFLSLLLIPVILFACIAIDAVRINGAEAIASDAVDLVLKTAICDFDRVLYDTYGLLAISSNEEELSSNLVKYYENTINSFNLDINIDDSYTQAILRDIKSSIFSDDMNFSNLINMTCTDFNVACIKGSELYNTEVTKRQIIEYMKYRGLLSMGEGFISKIKAFSEVPAQQQLIEKKGEYDLLLCDFQDICQKTYDDMMVYDVYFKELDGYNIQKFIEESVNGVACSGTDDVQYEGMKNINRMVKAICKNEYVSYNTCKDAVVDEGYLYIYDYLYSTVSNVIDYISKYEAPDKADEIVDYYFAIMENSLKMEKIFLYYSVLDDVFEKYKNEIIESYEVNENIRKELAKKNNTKYVPLDNYELEEAIEQFIALREFLDSNLDFLKEYIDIINNKDKYIKENVNTKVKLLNNYLLSKYNLIKDISNRLNSIKNNLVIIKNDYLPELEKSAENWKSSINNLSNGDIKTNLDAQYSKITKNISTNDIDIALSETNAILDYYNNELLLAEEVSFYNMKLCSKNIKNAFQNISSNSSTISENVKNTTYMAADYELDSNINCPNISDSYILINNLKDCNFYKFLDQNCVSKSDMASNDTDVHVKKEHESLVNTIQESSEKLERLKLQYDDVNIIPDSGDVYSDFATTILQSIAEKEDVDSIEGIDKNFKADNIKKSKKLIKNTNNTIDSYMTAINGVGKFFSGLAENSRDNLLITEYITEMFSCLTTNRINENIDEKTLAGISINENNNYIFGGEQEYILWGKNGKSTSKNITYTLSTIYGLRLVLNTIYAYTDVEIRTWTMSMALALAGWTGFGVPIIQNILILIMSMGETAIDVVRIANGESTVIYKSYSTWVLKPSGIGKESIEYIKTSLEETVDKLTDKIEQLSINFTDEKIQELNYAIDEYVDELIDNLSESITASIITPLQIKLDMIINKAITEPVDIIIKELDDIYSQLRLAIENEEDSIAKSVKLIVINEFIDEEFDEIKNQLVSIKSMTDNAVSDARRYVENLINDLSTEIKQKIQSNIINSGCERIKQEAKNEISKIKNNIKYEANRVINNIANKFSANLYSTPYKNSYIGESDDNFNISALSMNYKEYLKLFILSGLCTGKDERYISRMMDIIKLNMTCSSNYGSEDFRLEELSTMLKVYTQTRVETTFLNYKLFDNPLKENRYYIEIESVYGY